MTKQDDKLRSAIEAVLEERGFRNGPTTGAKKCGEGVYLVAYESRNPGLVFVPDPCKRGRFCRVPRAFLYRGCPACGALPGQPCNNHRHGSHKSWSGSTGHADRGGHSQEQMPQSFYDDVVVEQALLLFAKLVLSNGVEIKVNHTRDCPQHNSRSRKSCSCRRDEREKAIAKAILRLPDLSEIDDVTERKR